MDGIEVIRTSEPEAARAAEQAVRSYKNLAQVERPFRTLKGVDLRIRPIHHRNETRVRAHILLCLLAYYVERQMRRALAPLLFDDESLPIERNRRDPVAPAQPSPAAQRKKTQRFSGEGLPIHSFRTLMAELGTRCGHRCRLKADPESPVIEQDTQPTPLQARALELIRLFPVEGIRSCQFRCFHWMVKFLASWELRLRARARSEGHGKSRTPGAARRRVDQGSAVALQVRPGRPLRLGGGNGAPPSTGGYSGVPTER